MARALRAWAINQREKNSVRNFQYGPRTQLVRGIYRSYLEFTHLLETFLDRISRISSVLNLHR